MKGIPEATVFSLPCGTMAPPIWLDEHGRRVPTRPRPFRSMFRGPRTLLEEFEISESSLFARGRLHETDLMSLIRKSSQARPENLSNNSAAQLVLNLSQVRVRALALHLKPIRRRHDETDISFWRGPFPLRPARALTVLRSGAPSHPGSLLTQRASDPLGYGLASLC